jgi:hypothetical protein
MMKMKRWIQLLMELDYSTCTTLGVHYGWEEMKTFHVI